MRLLNTTTLELHEFFDANIPSYAILSHRWEDGEVSFKDVIKPRNLKAPGWIKIAKACDLARMRKHKWIWIDTCSIDKISSAELSEAIKSMYRWYERAQECYVYLNDVSCRGQDLAKTKGWLPLEESLSEYVQEALRSSDWFNRGWTLQELLAPSHILFIEKYWKGVIGTKDTLAPLLSEITGIREMILASSSLFLGYHAGIAQRMSWASKRVCSGEEDTAYCSLGIFDVNIPLIYGEGRCRAFRRLQLEILKKSNDESIFAWSQKNRSMPLTGKMLAECPSELSNSASIELLESRMWAPRAPYSMTNRAMAFQTILRRLDTSGDVIMPLRCYDYLNPIREGGLKNILAIRLSSRQPPDYEMDPGDVQ
jgi:hypothetical protein